MYIRRIRVYSLTVVICSHLLSKLQNSAKMQTGSILLLKLIEVHSSLVGQHCLATLLSSRCDHIDTTNMTGK